MVLDDNNSQMGVVIKGCFLPQLPIYYSIYLSIIGYDIMLFPWVFPLESIDIYIYF